MNKIKFFMMVCLLGIAATASAQFANVKGSSSHSGDINGWQGLRVSYHPMSLSPDEGDNIGITGFSIGYVKGFSLSQNVPIYLEAGANLLWGSKDVTDDFGLDFDDYEIDASAKLNLFSVNVPINFGYKYAVNDNFSIYPYIGVNFKINAIGKIKIEAEYEGESESESLDLFSKDDMGEAWKRFQVGWQIGVAFNINKFTLAAGYGKDFTEITKKVKVAMPSLTVGFNF